jgi:adenylate cyclase
MPNPSAKSGFFSSFTADGGGGAEESGRFWVRWTDCALRYGISGYDRETRRRLFLVNLSGYLSAISSLSYAINFSLHDFSALKWLIFGNLLSAFLTASAPFWHRYNSLGAALMMTATVAVTLFFFVSELGRDSGVQLNYIGAVAIAFVIFGLNHMRIIAAITIVCIVGHIATVYLFPVGRVQWAIDEAFMTQLYVMSATSIMLILGLVVWYAFRVAADAEARSERLLMNIFPETIANRLRMFPDDIIADRFDEASVLFADIVGFTKMSNELEAEELILLLNEIFSAFDAIGAKLHTEKIKTIGDAYMAVSGAPEPVEDHSERILKLAIGMIAEIARVSEAHQMSLDIRIGIAAGPITAGVIGKAKFAYDVWAPTVNLASRLESSGKVGRIQVSSVVYRALKEKYRFEKAEVKDLKGIGQVQSWYYVGTEA